MPPLFLSHLFLHPHMPNHSAALNPAYPEVLPCFLTAQVFISGQYEEPEKMAEEMMEELDNRYDVWDWLSDRERDRNQKLSIIMKQ